MAEDRSLASLRDIEGDEPLVWITTEEYVEWNVDEAPDWKIVAKDLARDMILITRVSSNDTEGEK